ncbi:MAG: hypothetical protein HYS71_01885, partial [Candidatus Omnitrophica bacterium]|nr:hypothetical protein [Candidatus Omnitrophota bacterium]
WLVSALPAAFMLTMTLWSLILTVQPWLLGLLHGQPTLNWIALVALILLALAILVIVEALKAFVSQTRSAQDSK